MQTLGAVILILVFALAIVGPALLGGWLRKRNPLPAFWGPLFRRIWRKRSDG